MSFGIDLPLGQEHERTLREWLLNKNKDYKSLPLNKNSDYDIVLYNTKKSRRETFELKYDKHPNPNVAIEFFCLRRFQETGLAVTTADWFVIEKDNYYYFIKPQKLKDYIRETKPIIKFGGDNNEAVLYIIPVSEYEKISIKRSK